MRLPFFGVSASTTDRKLAGCGGRSGDHRVCIFLFFCAFHPPGWLALRESAPRRFL